MEHRKSQVDKVSSLLIIYETRILLCIYEGPLCAPNAVIRSSANGAGRQQVEAFQTELVQPLRLFTLIDKERASQYFPAVNRAAGVSDRLPSRGSRGYRSVNATSSELNTGLNIYRMIDFEPV
jgi:hypothetical protein